MQDVLPDTRMLSLASNIYYSYIGCYLIAKQREFLGDPLEKSTGNFIYFNKHHEKMRNLQKVSLVNHSAPTKMLSELLMYADSKRFNIPIKKLGKFVLWVCVKI